MSNASTKPLPSGKTLSLRRETVRTLKVRSGVATGDVIAPIGGNPSTSNSIGTTVIGSGTVHISGP